MKPVNLDVSISELVLRGFPHADSREIGPIVEAELTRLFAEQGVPPSLSGGGELAHVDGGKFRVPSGAKPEAIGSRIAQAVYRGLAK